MNLTKFGVNLDNMKSINFDKYEKNFTFIVDGKKYETSRFLADFISPIVNKYHYEDEATNEITLRTNINHDQNEDYFNEFLSLFTFEDQEIDYFHHKIYCEYFLQLGNDKEYSRLHQAYLSNVTPENVIDHLIQEKELFDEELIKYASFNFEKISKTKFKKLKIDIIEEIINNESLKIDNEDSLLEFILDLYKIDNKYSVLFEYVIFNNVTLEAFNKFINEFEVENINSRIWSGIRERILSKNTIVVNDRYSHKERIIHKDYNEKEEVNGLLRYLTDQTGGNIHDNGTVFISSNSILKEKNHPKNLVNFREDDLTCFQSRSGIPDAFVCFDLKDRKIQLTSYTIKTHKKYFHLKNWVIEVSNDEENWLIIDEHKNETKLNQSGIICNFKINQETEFYSFIRLRQTGFSWANTNQTLFYYIEFYGNLKEFY